METPPRFDLSQAIATWREELLQRPGFTLADVQELEGHLRETLGELQEQGHDLPNAFALASQRLGKPGEIACEFFRADPGKVWRLRLWWMVLGVFVYWVWSYLTVAWPYASSRWLGSLLIYLFPYSYDPFWADEVANTSTRLAQLPLLLLLFFLVQTRWGHPLRTLLSRLNSRWKMSGMIVILGLAATAQDIRHQFNFWFIHGHFDWQYFNPVHATLLVLAAFVIGLAPVNGKIPAQTAVVLPLWRESVRWMVLGLTLNFLFNALGLVWLSPVLLWASVPNSPYLFWAMQMLQDAGFVAVAAWLLRFDGRQLAHFLTRVAASPRGMGAALMITLLTVIDSQYFFMLLRPEAFPGLAQMGPTVPWLLITRYTALALIILLLAPKPVGAKDRVPV
jgi:hypothetical protein